MPFHKSLIVVPTYNEVGNVERVSEDFLKPLDGSELLFVDDASPDGTGPLIDKICKNNNRVHVLHRRSKLGLGSAYVEGFEWGLRKNFDYIFEMDADYSHHPMYLPAMLEACIKRADVAIGSRYVDGGGTKNWSVIRKLISRGAGIYSRQILGVDLKDMTSGFICWSKRALLAVDLKDIQSDGYNFQIEMKYRALKKGLKVEEVPIVFSDRQVGKSKMNHMIFLEAMFRVWQLRFKRFP